MLVRWGLLFALCGVVAGQTSQPAAEEVAAEGPSRLEAIELAIDEQADAALLEAAGEGFELRHTKHFVCAYNTDRPTVAALMTRMEGTYAMVCRFARICELPMNPPPHKLQVIFFNNGDDYWAYNRRTQARVPADAPGYYASSTHRSCFYNFQTSPQFVRMQGELERIRSQRDQLRKTRSDQPSGGARTQSRQQLRQLEQQICAIRGQMDNYLEQINCTIVQHETGHQVTFETGMLTPSAQNPFWIVEGLAMQFETPPGKFGAGLGAINQRRLGDFLAATEQGQSLDVSRLMSLEQLCVAGINDWRDRVDPAHAYAEAWALVYYLRRTEPTKFGAYLLALSKRQPGQQVTADAERQLFVQTFGPPDGNFEGQWLQFMEKLPYQPP